MRMSRRYGRGLWDAGGWVGFGWRYGEGGGVCLMLVVLEGWGRGCIRERCGCLRGVGGADGLVMGRIFYGAAAGFGLVLWYDWGGGLDVVKATVGADMAYGSSVVIDLRWPARMLYT
ncbi:hypothetical protein Tco_0408891 [Tanacetum coccineum]